MNIRITRLSMTNFKCFREKDMNLDEDIITIRGHNGSGKTTIADAILFCLFGKNTEGQSDLEIFKTRNDDGKVIPNLDHSVEMTLAISSVAPSDRGETAVTLRRSIKEVWVKRRGSEETVFKNNTVDYFINGESQTKADYEKYIASLIDERVFRAITNPNYFPSLKWQDQRALLIAMVGEVKLPADNAEFADLLKQLEGSNEDIVSYLKHLKYQIKQVKDKLDRIPVRLEEQNKALPERLDWDLLAYNKELATEQLKDIEQKILAIQQGNGSYLQRAEIRKQIESLQTKMYIIEEKARDTIRKATAEHNQKVSELSMKFNEALNNQKLMEQTIAADKRLIQRCEQAIKESDEELERLRLAWPTRKFMINNQLLGVCPTCGQVLPEEQWNEKKKQMEENFNKELEAEKQSLRDKAAKVKQTKEDAQQELTSNENKLQLDTESLAEIKQSINAVFAEKAKEEKRQLPTFDDFLPCDEEYQAALREKTDLDIRLDNLSEDSDMADELRDLQAKKMSLDADIINLTQQLATYSQYERIAGIIDDINDEQKDLVRQLSELEKREDVARQFQARQNGVLECLINEQFSLVQWHLFRTVNNGGDSFEEPYCEAYVYGIPYHAGLNQAARLNAGLDICEALCRFYNVSAPIVIDNAESNLNICHTTGQQIRLQVFDSELSLV